MICPKCSSQIQIKGTDAERSSSISCPKCNTTLSAVTVSPASEKSGLAIGQSPSTEQRRFIARVPAPLFELENTAPIEAPGPAVPMEEISQLLANLLRQHGVGGALARTSRPAWNPRKALVCIGELHRDAVATQLTQNGYQVFVAQDTGQAVDRMRENQVEVVILDPDFDSAEHGAAFVIREVSILRPAQRRRLFFVLLSPLQRTMDAHAAFLHNVNAIVNFKEVDQLFKILDHALREYNDLYKELNQALNVAAL